MNQYFCFYYIAINNGSKDVTKTSKAFSSNSIEVYYRINIYMQSMYAYSNRDIIM